jgi:hypothetical protein
MAMKEKEYIEFLRSRNQTEEAIEAALGYVRDFETYLVGVGKSLEAFSVGDLKEYVAMLIAGEKNTMERFLALARYVYTAGLNSVFIYFTSIVGGREVLPSISEKLAAVAGEEVRDAVFDGLAIPPLGSSPDEYPKVTNMLVRRLKDLGAGTCHAVLADNHHGVPAESFNKHKAWLAEADDLDGFLVRVHEEAVAELERYMNEGKVWYEQEITPEVVEFVRGNQEVLSAVRDGGYLYITKLPYSPKDWLKEADPVMKRYYGCHCPLARAAIIMGEPDIPLDWCYCSGGFEKLMFDVVFEEPTQVEVLESVLAGDPRCRFRVKLPVSRLS